MMQHLILLSTLLMGSRFADDLELSRYIESVKQRAPQFVTPIPIFKSPSQYIISEKDNRANPFKLLDNPATDKVPRARVVAAGEDGKRISLNFQDIHVRAVLQLVAEFTGINIVVSDTVTGNISLRLHDVPWEQALDTILNIQGLDKRQIGNVILIDQAAVIAARRNESYKKQLAAQQLRPLRSDLLQVNYAKAVDIATMLKDKTNSLLTDRGTISVDARTNTLWLRDTPAQIERIKALVHRLDVPVKQVVIEARIVNINKHCAEDIGVRFGISKSTYINGTLEGANRSAQGVLPADIPVHERLNLDLGAIPLDATPASIGIALAKLGDHVLLDMELSALESEGRAKVVASPKLVTTNQQAAVIESGEDIPYQEAMASGATSVAFKKVVLRLKVTPQITPDNKLLMDLLINQDSDSGRRVQGVPVILTKAIETSVLVDNGQTIVLGGIYKQDKNNTIVRVPFLGRLPFVGHLFSRKQIMVRNEELLIFITPRIIAANEDKQ